MDFSNSGDSPSNKFVCPSDRQLALRANFRARANARAADATKLCDLRLSDKDMHMLQTGWSTGKLNSPLHHEEQAVILSVIRRNEDLESAERLRIGRLVERLEKLKQRAAECGPHCCRLCGQEFGLLGPSRLICADCRKSVCSKCSIDINVKSPKHKEVWLCKICSESREIWKKSGAWFFKGLPRYEIPVKSSSARNSIRESKSQSERTTKLGMQIEESSSDDDTNSGGVNGRQTPIAGGGGIKREESFRLRAMGSFRSFSNSIFFNRQTSSSIDLNSQPDWDTMSVNSIVGYNRRESAQTRRGSVSSNWSISEASIGNGGNFNNLAQTCREPLLGWIELAVSYKEMDHTLECCVMRARDLPAMDSAGLADPFCKLNIVTAEANTKQIKWMKTKTVHKTRNPEFNENVSFMGVEPEELSNSILYVVILDDDKYGYDFLGTAKVALSPLYTTKQFRLSVPLASEDQYTIEACSSATWPRGQILIALSYNTKKRALIVQIKRCINLIPMDNNGSSDPFVKLQLKPDSHRKKYKTSIKWRNLNPIYNEEFQFEARPNDLDKQTLILTVWDKDIGKSNDFLGSLVIGCNSKGRRLKQWHDCLRLPDQFHEQWHCLSSEIPPH